MGGSHNKGATWVPSQGKHGGRSGSRSFDGHAHRLPKGPYGMDDDSLPTHHGHEALLAAHCQQAQVLPQMAGYQSAGLMYRVWLPPYAMQHSYSRPGLWQPTPPPLSNFRTWSTSPPAQQQTAEGTGVFLPSSSRVSGPESNMSEQQCSESDVDSAESTSECLLLDDSLPIRRGQITSSTPIEQILPEEWEY